MELYLIRHGIAEDRSKYNRDEDRPLTKKGYEKTNQVAEKLLKMGIKFDLILTSPLLRAKETAKILQKSGLSQTLDESNDLAPNGQIKNFVDWLGKSLYNYKSESYLALVGHQPNLSNWTEKLVWGSNTNNKIIIKKSGIIGVRLPEKADPIGNSELFLLTSPKWII